MNLSNIFVSRWIRGAFSVSEWNNHFNTAVMKNKIKEPVRLRQKSLAGGGASLYLDIYVDGVRRYEFLKLYLIPERCREDKARNQQTLALANSIKAARVVEVQNERFNVAAPKSDKILFFEYFQMILQEKQGTTQEAWRHCLAHMRIYDNREWITFKDVTRSWVEGFRMYLDRSASVWDIDGRKRRSERAPLSQGTKGLYFQKLAAALNQAVRDGIIQSSPMAGVRRFSEVESSRQFLTLEELRVLAATPAPDEVLRRAFLFSCLTGLRWSDIVKLRWEDVERSEDGARTRIVFRQQKTGGLEYLDVSAQAAVYLGKVAMRGEIFGRFLTPQTARIGLAAWVRAAGIKKHITFHCGRHTFAVMMLDLGVDIYTLSKLLGHRDLSSTQIYAKILDKNKQAAVERIPEIEP